MESQKQATHARKQEQKVKEEQPTYKLTYSRLVACYLLAGLLGTIWETAVIWVSTGRFEFRNASFISPFNFVYGSGFVLMVVCLHRLKNPLALFFFSALLGGVAEYGLSWAEELAFHTRSWNYEGLFLNIGGRTTIPYMIVWGIAGALIIRYLFPLYMKALNKIPPKILTTLAVVATVYIVADIALTSSVLVRFYFRRNGKAAFTFIGKKIDFVFKEEVIRRYFPNMVFS